MEKVNVIGWKKNNRPLPKGRQHRFSAKSLPMRVRDFKDYLQQIEFISMASKIPIKWAKINGITVYESNIGNGLMFETQLECEIEIGKDSQ